MWQRRNVTKGGGGWRRCCRDRSASVCPGEPGVGCASCAVPSYRVRALDVLVRLRRAACGKGRTFRAARRGEDKRAKRWSAASDGVRGSRRMTDRTRVASVTVTTMTIATTTMTTTSDRRREWTTREGSPLRDIPSYTPSGTAASHGLRSFVDTAGWRHEPRDDWPAPRCPDTWIVAEQAWQFDAQWFSALVKCHRHAPDRSGYNPRFAARSETVGFIARSSRSRTRTFPSCRPAVTRPSAPCAESDLGRPRALTGSPIVFDGRVCRSGDRGTSGTIARPPP